MKKLYFVFFKILKFYIVFKKFLSDFQTIYKFFFLHTKTSKDLCARNYQKKQNKIQKKSREKYQNLIELEKNKNREYCRERYKIICCEFSWLGALCRSTIDSCHLFLTFHGQFELFMS